MILAIDPGLASTGWALVDGMEYIASGTVHTKPKDGDLLKRCGVIAKAIYEECYELNPDVWDITPVIEQPYSGQFKGSSETYFLAGYLAGDYGGEQVRMVNPNTWAKGKAEQKRNEAVLVYKVKTRTSEHERDALAIALWAATGGIK